MDNTEYYKSLISDDEVIKALIRESKAREGELFKEKTRVRPNLNFFQRTVTNLVSSNKRISTIPEFTPKQRNKDARKVKSPCAIMREILLTNKINFVKAEESFSNTDFARKSRLVDLAEENQTNYKLNKYFSKNDDPSKLPTKSGTINFNLNFKDKYSSSASSSTSEDLSRYEKRKLSISSDSSEDRCEGTVISISSTECNSSSSLSSESDVISLSDSDKESSKLDPLDSRPMKSKKVCRMKCKKKLQKKRKKRRDL